MPHVRQFHNHHGSNIVLCDNDTTAYRKSSFANGIVFSHKPVAPGEIFCVEIEKNEPGWSGHLRIGLTTFNPDSGGHIPAYGLPDLVNAHRSWLVAVQTPPHCCCRRRQPPHSTATSSSAHHTASPSAGYVRTCYGVVARAALCSSASWCGDDGGGRDDRLPTDVGSRLAVLYEPAPQETLGGRMYVLVNGVLDECRTACVDLPASEATPLPLHAVVDVYGSTKQVRIVQLYGVRSLMSVCRSVIVENLQNINECYLPLPPALKNYVAFKS